MTAHVIYSFPPPLRGGNVNEGNGVIMKQCPKCGNRRPFTKFSLGQSYCKECASKYAKQYRESGRAKQYKRRPQEMTEEQRKRNREYMRKYREEGRDKSRPRSVRAGYLYVVREVDTGYVKIGVAKDSSHRLSSHQSSNSSAVELVKEIYSDDVLALERKYHRKFSKRRVRGEWFDLRPWHVRGIK